MPARNAAATIEESVRSVLTQSLPDFELLIVENQSSDSTPQMAEDMARGDSRIRVTTDGPAGPAAARNLAIEQARGAWMTFLDADDEYEPGFLEHIARLAQSHPGYDAFVTNGVIIGGRISGPILHGRRFSRDGPLDLAAVIGMKLYPGQIAIRSDVVRALNGFRESGRAEDYDLWLRLFAERKGYYSPERLFRYRVDPGSRSHDPEGRVQFARSILATLELARDITSDPEALAAIEDRQAVWRRVIESWPRRAELERRLAAGSYAGARRAYLGARGAYQSQRAYVLGLPLMMLSPRLFARLTSHRG